MKFFGSATKTGDAAVPAFIFPEHISSLLEECHSAQKQIGTARENLAAENARLQALQSQQVAANERIATIIGRHAATGSEDVPEALVREHEDLTMLWHGIRIQEERVRLATSRLDDHTSRFSKLVERTNSAWREVKIQCIAEARAKIRRAAIELRQAYADQIIWSACWPPVQTGVGASGIAPHASAYVEDAEGNDQSRCLVDHRLLIRLENSLRYAGPLNDEIQRAVGEIRRATHPGSGHETEGEG